MQWKRTLSRMLYLFLNVCLYLFYRRWNLSRAYLKGRCNLQDSSKHRFLYRNDLHFLKWQYHNKNPTEQKCVGYLVGYPDKVKAIRNLRPPNDIFGVCSFMGIVQFGKFQTRNHQRSVEYEMSISELHVFYFINMMRKPINY